MRRAWRAEDQPADNTSASSALSYELVAVARHSATRLIPIPILRDAP
jgi:hypothetical protein